MAARSNLQRSAEYYASEMGLRVFPCWPRAKNPVTPNGCRDATTDLDQIVRWWTYSSGNNVAIATGGGLVVLDVDINHDAGKYGDETLSSGLWPDSSRFSGSRAGFLQNDAGSEFKDHGEPGF